MMCQKFSIRKTSTPPQTIQLIFLMLILLCFAECAAGICSKYGHACWGAHGKRNDNSYTNLAYDIPNKDLSKIGWFLTKLLQRPFDLRLLRSREFDSPTKQQTGDRELFDGFPDALKGDDEWDSGSDSMENSVFNDIPSQQSTSRLLNKRSI